MQFISGMALRKGDAKKSMGSTPSGSRKGDSRERDQEEEQDSLVLSYGVNDCEARLGLMPVERTWSMLRPVGSSQVVCGA